MAQSSATTATKAPRDHRVDLLRGLALASIFINHMPDNTLGNYTSRNVGFSDAAEVFVLLAGYAAALAYYPAFASGARGKVVISAGRRAMTLYAAHVAMTFAAIAMFWLFLSAAGPSAPHDLIGVAPLLADPLPGVAGVLSGILHLSYFNILPMYVVLLAALPAMLWVAARSVWLLGGLSLVVYLIANIFSLSLPGYSQFDSWFFNPLAWQFLFVAGLVLGMRHCRGERVGYDHVVFFAGLAYLAFSAAWKIGGWGGQIADGFLPFWAGTLDKPNLPPARLLHILALTYVVCHSPLWKWLGRVPASFVVTRMGRNSLPVFVIGSLLSMVGWMVSKTAGGGIAVDAAVVTTGLLVIAAEASWLEAKRSKSDLPRRGPVPDGTSCDGTSCDGGFRLAGQLPHVTV